MIYSFVKKGSLEAFFPLGAHQTLCMQVAMGVPLRNLLATQGLEIGLDSFLGHPGKGLEA